MTYIDMIPRIRFLIDAANVQRFSDSRIADAINVATTTLIQKMTQGLVYGDMSDSNRRIIEKMITLYRRDFYAQAVITGNYIDVAMPGDYYHLQGMRVALQNRKNTFYAVYEVKPGIASRFDDMVRKDPYTSINTSPENLYMFPELIYHNGRAYQWRIYHALPISSISGAAEYNPNVVSNKVFIDYIVKPTDYGINYNIPEVLYEDVCQIAAQLLIGISAGTNQN